MLLADCSSEVFPDSDLKDDVASLHKEMLHALDKSIDHDSVQDIDALGNIIYKDPDRPTRNYWGFSLDGVGKMKQMASHFQEKATGYADVVMDRPPPPPPPFRQHAAAERGRSQAAGRGRGFAPPPGQPPRRPNHRNRGNSQWHYGDERY